MIKVFLLLSLFLTRFVGLNWGYPYLFHPDENNISSSLLQLSCRDLQTTGLSECFNPHFYAYGQLPIYLGRVVLSLLELFFQTPENRAVGASFALRLISALASVLTAGVLYRWLKQEFVKEWPALVGVMLYIFSPIFIQFAHFGTTESLLLLLFVSLLYLRNRNLLSGFLIGLSGAIKLSALILAIVPLLQLFQGAKFSLSKEKWKGLFLSGLSAILTFVLFTPHYWLNFAAFSQSLAYEAGVASGSLRVFYTEQFKETVPLLFTLRAILPYALGWGQLILAIIGSLVALIQKRLRLLFVFSILLGYQLMLYAQWARFWLYLYPLFLYFATLSLVELRRVSTRFFGFVVLFLTLGQILTGLAFFSIYLKEDSRLSAAAYLLKRAPKEAVIAAESANVVDLSLRGFWPNYYSNYLYDIETNPALRQKVFKILAKADYVVVDSRRVFRNYSCFYFVKGKLKEEASCSKTKRYSFIGRYYSLLFNSGKFRLVATFSSFPELGKWYWEDENAEETISVFDHPVVRIYQRK